jgi:hypothetical protein
LQKPRIASTEKRRNQKQTKEEKRKKENLIFQNGVKFITPPTP